MVRNAWTQVQDLRAAGQEPYAYRFDRTHYTSELQVSIARGEGALRMLISLAQK